MQATYDKSKKPQNSVKVLLLVCYTMQKAVT